MPGTLAAKMNRKSADDNQSLVRMMELTPIFRDSHTVHDNYAELAGNRVRSALVIPRHELVDPATGPIRQRCVQVCR